MAYAIEPKSTKDFLNMETNLPRFQRKQTWKPISNFKLCISIFKNYPIGVVIINKNKDGNWLLDGRQRLNALTQINNNPEEVYKWAMKFIKFKSSSQPDEIKSLYWNRINEYLQKNYEEDIYNENETNEDEDNNSELILNSDSEINNIHSFDPNEQKKGLDILLDLILMVHNFRGGRSSWERTFDFSKIIDKTLTYYKVENGVNVFCPELLIKAIDEMIILEREKKTKNTISKATFIDYYCNRYYLDDKAKNKLCLIVDQTWNDIEFSFATISKVKKVLEDSRVGIIEITAASDLDAQNIFSLVNSGGTQLTAEELLSAKPYWNVIVNNASKDVSEYVQKLYDKLEVVHSGDVVRWDLCATLINRIDKNGFIFEKRQDKDSFASQTTLGFKLFSSIFVGGISSISVSSIENKNLIDWETEFEPFVLELNNLCDLLEDHDYFKCMKKWGQSIMSLTSSTIALEFITIIYKEWEKIGKKRVDCSETRALKRNAVSLLDKLIFEYSNKQWRGSSDSKLASDIMSIGDRINPKDKAEWIELLDNLAKGIINDQTVTQNLVKPILFHAKYISEEYPSVTDATVNYDLDHIYPKALFSNNSNVDANLKDSLCNLEILSSKANKEKNDKKLLEINSAEVKNEISKSSGISYTDFVKYSDISNINDLIRERLSILKEVYSTNRDKMLMN